MKLIVFILLVIYISGCYTIQRRIPDYVSICKRKDPNLNECFRKGFMTVIHHLGNGIPELNLRKINPVEIAKLHLNFGEADSSVSFNAILTDMKLFGMQDGNLEKSILDLDNVIFDLTIKIPHLRMESNYNAKGKVLLLQFDSKGEFWGNFTNVLVTGKWMGYKYMKKENEHAMFNDTDIDVKIEKLEMHFDNLFPNNEEITENTNKAINDNIDVLYAEIKPLVLETMRTIVLESVNNVYKAFPLNTLFTN